MVKVIFTENYSFYNYVHKVYTPYKSQENNRANDRAIKCLNFSENRDWVYIIGASGIKEFDKVCVSWMIVLVTGSV